MVLCCYFLPCPQLQRLPCHILPLPPQQAPDIYITDQIIRRPYHIPKKRLAYTEDYNKGSRLEKTIVFSHQIYRTTPTFPLCLLLLRTKPTTTLWFGWGTERKGVEEKVCLAHQPPSLKVDTDSHIIFSHMPLLLVCGQHRLPHMPLASCYYLQKFKKKILTGDEGTGCLLTFSSKY